MLVVGSPGRGMLWGSDARRVGNGHPMVLAGSSLWGWWDVLWGWTPAKGVNASHPQAQEKVKIGILSSFPHPQC